MGDYKIMRNENKGEYMIMRGDEVIWTEPTYKNCEKIINSKYLEAVEKMHEMLKGE